MTMSYGAGQVLLGALVFFCALIGAVILVWAAAHIIGELLTHARGKWRRVANRPKSRFYVPKGRL